MKFDVLTLFPEMFESILGTSIIGRAIEKGLLEVNYVNIRDYSTNKHRKVDDYPYGGGSGMLMSVQPIYDAWRSVCTKDRPYTIYMSPQGKPYKQAKAKELLEHKHIAILCGHYEGVDQRVIDEIVDEEISLGDFVLTGGEIAAMAVIDSMSRMVDGVLSSEESYLCESHSDGLLEYPQYTRPDVALGKRVPEVLLNGDHAKIAKWRHEKAVENTFNKRPDMYKKYIQDNS